MDTKNKIKIITINISLFIVLYTLISFNKEFIRPQFGNLEFVKILTGSFPNFIASLIISLTPVSAVLIKKPKYGRAIVYVISIIVFVVLSFEEVVPLWGASTQYDLFDILASALGSLTAIIIFELIVKNKSVVE